MLFLYGLLSYRKGKRILRRLTIYGMFQEMRDTGNNSGCKIKQDDGKGQSGVQNKTDPASSPKIKIKKRRCSCNDCKWKFSLYSKNGKRLLL
jgi:hypothetical protein